MLGEPKEKKNIQIYLHSAHNAARVHARCNIHRIAPYVVLWLLGTDNAGNHRPMIETDAQTKTLKAFTVDLIQHRHQSGSKFHHNCHIVLFYASLILYVCAVQSRIQSTAVTAAVQIK